MVKCPICKRNSYHYYNGALGYEAMKCSNCGFESSATSPSEFKNDVRSFKILRGYK